MHLFSDVLAWFLCISSHTVFPHRRQDPARAPGSRTFPNPAAALTLSWDFELRFPYVIRSVADRSSGQPGPHTSTQYPSTDLRRHSASRGTPRVSDGSRYQIRCHGGRFGRDFLLEPVNLKSMLVSRPPRAQYRGEPRDKFVFSDPSSDRLFKGYSHARPPPRYISRVGTSSSPSLKVQCKLQIALYTVATPAGSAKQATKRHSSCKCIHNVCS